jgi:uncharacterized OB-fold protein
MSVTHSISTAVVSDNINCRPSVTRHIMSVRTILTQFFVGDEADVITECRDCGTSVSSETDRCPECGSSEIGRYRIQG